MELSRSHRTNDDIVQASDIVVCEPNEGKKKEYEVNPNSVTEIMTNNKETARAFFG